MHSGHLGAQAGIVRSPTALKRRRKAREAEDRRWASQSSPVTTTKEGSK